MLRNKKKNWKKIGYEVQYRQLRKNNLSFVLRWNQLGWYDYWWQKCFLRLYSSYCPVIPQQHWWVVQNSFNLPKVSADTISHYTGRAYLHVHEQVRNDQQDIILPARSLHIRERNKDVSHSTHYKSFPISATPFKSTVMRYLAVYEIRTDTVNNETFS